ncbi:MAG: DUF2062 domain-containing protein [Rhodobacteraceae bacterium]|nr:DUF2062 domain-containing protein [Paracoccaceae bacterium]
MVFKRRDKLHWVESLRSYVLPRAGWWRTLVYLGHRLRRIPDSPTRIARGVAFGVFISFSPLFGFHIILALLMAKVFRANIIAALAGTAIGNPLTFPFIIGAALKIGTFVLGRDPAEHDLKHVAQTFREAFRAIWESFKSLFGFGHSNLHGLGDFFSDIMLPYAIGGTLLGLIFAFAGFYITKPIILAYQKLRRKNLAKKAKKKHSEG